MIAALARFAESYLNISYEKARLYLDRLIVTIAASAFILLGTVIVAFDTLFPGEQAPVATLELGDVAQQDIYAPRTITYPSDVLTAQQQAAAAAAVPPIFDAPDPSVARQQTELAQSILDYIDNIRRDPYATTPQRVADIKQITALDLAENTIIQVLDIDQDTWEDIQTEIIAILERVMRGEIKSEDLPRIRSQLPTQVSVRFSDDREIQVIVAVVSDLLRANTRENTTETEAARQAAVNGVTAANRSFAAGQLVIASGTVIDQADYEALQRLGLLQPARQRTEDVTRALIANIIALVVIGLFLARFNPDLMDRDPQLLMLLGSLFIITLFGAQLTDEGQFYIYPTAALALTFVAITSAQIAVIGTLGLAFLIGLMNGDSLEVTVYVAVGGIIGTLTLQRAERLNSFFLAGLIVGVSNLAVAALFNLASDAESAGNLLLILGMSFVNGILAATAAVALMYVVTTIFNLPTALKLLELSQPNQPLLQRLLREAPGTYQHSLQVANLSEQAANAIGANAELTRVAALYHDIGKMLNPVFFTENQGTSGNPHDALNDPYRSADIIISHVTEGDNLARQHRLPNRLRDFIREHHGTSSVYVFYRQAVILAGDDESQVDVNDFSYRGPKPQSRETGVLLLADSCEATVRSRQPKSRAEIEEIVQSIIDQKRTQGQLDDSGLTLKDLKRIHGIFVDILQAMYHPRINYSEAISRVRGTGTAEKDRAAASPPPPPRDENPVPAPRTEKPAASPASNGVNTVTPRTPITPVSPIPPVHDDVDADEDTPLAEVPRLRRTGEHHAVDETNAAASDEQSTPTTDDNQADGDA